MDNRHCNDEQYEIHVTVLPGSVITWENEAVITTDCCHVILAVFDFLRHHRGTAHFGPAGSMGPVTEEAATLGVTFLNEVRTYGEAILEEMRTRYIAHLN